MELVLKIPKGKPPFIGLQYGEHVADRDNADLIRNNWDKEYKIVLEYTERILELKLICEELVTVRFYNHVTFDPIRLKDWLYITRESKSFNFGHVYLKGNTHIVARVYPEKRPFVLKVVNLKFVTSENGYKENPFTVKGGHGDWHFL